MVWSFASDLQHVTSARYFGPEGLGLWRSAVCPSGTNNHTSLTWLKSSFFPLLKLQRVILTMSKHLNALSWCNVVRSKMVCCVKILEYHHFARLNRLYFPLWCSVGTPAGRLDPRGPGPTADSVSIRREVKVFFQPGFCTHTSCLIHMLGMMKYSIWAWNSYLTLSSGLIAQSLSKKKQQNPERILLARLPLNIPAALARVIVGHETWRWCYNVLLPGVCPPLLTGYQSWLPDCRWGWRLPLRTVLFSLEGQANENNNVSLAYLHLHRASAVLWDLLAISCDRKTVIKKIWGKKKKKTACRG